AAPYGDGARGVGDDLAARVDDVQVVGERKTSPPTDSIEHPPLPEREWPAPGPEASRLTSAPPMIAPAISDDSLEARTPSPDEAKARPHLLVMMPALNEEATLERVIKS